MTRDGVGLSSLEHSLDYAVGLATTVGSAVRINDCEEVSFIYFVAGYVNGTHTLQPQYATPDPAAPSTPLASSWADIPAADLIGDPPVIDGAGKSNLEYQLGFKKHGNWEFVRLQRVATVPGATGMGVGGAVRKTGLRFGGVHPDAGIGTRDGAHSE